MSPLADPLCIAARASWFCSTNCCTRGRNRLKSHVPPIFYLYFYICSKQLNANLKKLINIEIISNNIHVKIETIKTLNQIDETKKNKKKSNTSGNYRYGGWSRPILPVKLCTFLKRFHSSTCDCHWWTNMVAKHYLCITVCWRGASAQHSSARLQFENRKTMSAQTYSREIMQLKYCKFISKIPHDIF